MEKATTLYAPNMNKARVAVKRAAIYIRVSSEEQAKEGYSPGTQEEKAKDFIELNGYQIESRHIYTDLGYSGSVDKRPDLQRLLEAAKNKEFDVIVVYRMDRFFRNLRLLLNTVADLRDRGIEFKSVTEPFDTSTPTGRAMFANAGVFAEWMREVGLESRNEGMIKAMKEGKWLSGTARYGYDIDKEKQRLKISKKEILVVKMLFRWLVEEKLTEYKIQQRLNSMEVPTKFDTLKRKKTTGTKNWWNRRTIGRILRDEIYIGVFHYRKYIYPGRVKGENNLRPKEDWIKVEDKSLKIISEELYKKAQKQLDKNKELAPRNTKQTYVLQHKIVCGVDGRAYQSATRRYYGKDGNSDAKYYFCSAIRPCLAAEKCPSSIVSESRIIPPVWEKLKELLTNPETIINQIKKCLNSKDKREQVEDQLDNIRKAMFALETKREKYAELYAEGSITKMFYNKKIKEIEEKLEGLKKEDEKASQLVLTEEERQKRIKSVETLYSRLKEKLETATYDIKKEILQILVQKITRTGEKIDIEFNIPFTGETPETTLSHCGYNPRMD